MIDLNDVRQKRAKVIEKAGAILDGIERDHRDITDDEDRELKELHAEVKTMSTDIDRRQDQQNMEAGLKQVINPIPAKTVVIGTGRASSGDGEIRSWKDPKTGAPVHCGSYGQDFRSIPGQEIGGVPISELSPGRVVKAIVTGDWSGAENEVRATLKEGVSFLGGHATVGMTASTFIDLNREPARTVELGARVINYEGDSATFPRWATDPSFYNVAEGATITQSNPTMDAIHSAPLKLATRIPVSRELISDAVGIEDELTAMMRRAFNAELDRLALNGTGSQELLGLANKSDLTVVDAATGAISWDDLLDCVTEIRSSGNVEPSGWVTTAAVTGYLDKIVSGDAANAAKSYDIMPNALRPMAGKWTDSMTAGELLMGKWDSAFFAVRSDVELEVTTEGADSWATDTVEIKLRWRGNVHTSRISHFAILQAITS